MLKYNSSVKLTSSFYIFIKKTFALNLRRDLYWHIQKQLHSNIASIERIYESFYE